MSWENLPLKFYEFIVISKLEFFFLLNFVISNSRRVINHPYILLILHVCEIAWVKKNGLFTLYDMMINWHLESQVALDDHNKETMVLF